MRSRVREIGWMPPRCALRPGRVGSMASPARRASSAASSSTSRRAARAWATASRTRLIASPAALRCSAGSAPSCLSWAVMLPCLPSRPMRSASSASGVCAAAISSSARADRDWISLMDPWPFAKTNGEGLAPFPTCAGRLAARKPLSSVERRPSGRQGALGLLGQRRNPGRVVHGDVRQHLAVQGDAGLQQAVHETAVAQAVAAGSRVDAGDPQRTEIALLLLAADVGVLLRLDDRLLGDAEDLAAGVVVTLGLAQDLLVTAARLHATLDSCHCSVLLRDTAACGPGGRHPRRGRGSSAAGCASAWWPSW